MIDFDLGRLHLSPGEGRRLKLDVTLGAFSLGAQRYESETASVVLDVSRTSGPGYALRLRFAASVSGPCMRCLEDATPSFSIDAREADQPGAGDELDSPYVHDQVLELSRWARDALALALPAQVVCREDCAGLCPVCGENLNHTAGEHMHERDPDPRWAKLSELKFE